MIALQMSSALLFNYEPQPLPAILIIADGWCDFYTQVLWLLPHFHSGRIQMFDLAKPLF